MSGPRDEWWENSPVVFTEEEFNLRRDFATQKMEEPVVGWWIQHPVTCPSVSIAGGDCTCGADLYVVFSGWTKLVSVNGRLDFTLSRLH